MWNVVRISTDTRQHTHNPEKSRGHTVLPSPPSAPEAAPGWEPGFLVVVVVRPHGFVDAPSVRTPRRQREQGRRARAAINVVT